MPWDTRRTGPDRPSGRGRRQRLKHQGSPNSCAWGVSWRHAPSLGSRRSRAHHRMLLRGLCARELGRCAKIVPSPFRLDGLRASSDGTPEPEQAPRFGIAPLTSLFERSLLRLPCGQHAHDHGDHPTNGDQRRSARRAMAPCLGHRNHTCPARASRPQSPGWLPRVAGERQAKGARVRQLAGTGGQLRRRGDQRAGRAFARGHRRLRARA